MQSMIYSRALSAAAQEALLNGPALAPPPGVVSNFDNPDNQNTLGIALPTVGLIITTFFTLVRFYSRLFLLKSVKIEDYLIAIAYVFSVGHVVMMYLVTRNPGWFVHQWDMRLKDFETFLWYLHLDTNFYGAVVLCAKAAILREWLRIFVPTGKRNAFFWTTHVVLWINVLMYSGSILLTSLKCNPVDKAWHVLKDGHCADTKVIFVALAALNLASDLVILFLPQKVIWHLNMSFRKRIGVALVFAVGLLTIAAASMRIYTAQQYVISNDITYTQSNVGLWAEVELICIMLVITVPSTPQVFKGHNIFGFFTRLRSSLKGHQSRATTDGGSLDIFHKRHSDSDSHQAISNSHKDLSQDSYAMGNVPATKVAVTAADIPGNSDMTDGQFPDRSHIYMTQQFISYEQISDQHFVGQEYQIQHPWDATRRNAPDNWR